MAYFTNDTEIFPDATRSVEVFHLDLREALPVGPALKSGWTDFWYAERVIEACGVRNLDELMQLPVAEVGERTTDEVVGFYFWACLPGCLPDSEAQGQPGSGAPGAREGRVRLRPDRRRAERRALDLGDGDVPGEPRDLLAALLVRGHAGLRRRRRGRQSRVPDDRLLLDLLAARPARRLGDRQVVRQLWRDELRLVRRRDRQRGHPQGLQAVRGRRPDLSGRRLERDCRPPSRSVRGGGLRGGGA